MQRVFLFVLDSLGVGELPDAARFGDAGAHTLDHLVRAAGVPAIPRLIRLGLGHVPGVHSLPRVAAPQAAFGRMAERSPGKDTSTGHWEMMGCVLQQEFPVFAHGFPQEFLSGWARACELPGWLCNSAASGTEVIERFGREHIASKKPIVYTSADSVFQVAAHEQHFGLERLYAVCREARSRLTPLGVGRVIARPFVGEPGHFVRTYNRKDYSLLPSSETSLVRLQSAGVPTIGVGKIEDIFAGQGISESIHTEGNRDGMRATTERASSLERGLLFVNLVDFDMLYGHRRDPAGYRRALEDFDCDLVEFERGLRPGDVVLATADHGNDPTHVQTTDHTREYVPLLAWGPGCQPGVELGTRASFADLGASIESWFGLPARGVGRSFAAQVG